MTNMEKYINVFVESLMIEEEKVTKELKNQEIPEWDSIGHMNLIAGLEDMFDISMEAEDIMNLDTFEKGIQILSKYGIQIEV